jgi:hypothetical protein
MAATSREALLAVTEMEFEKLQKVIAKVPDTLALEKDGEDTCLRDILCHRAHWIDLFLGWYRDGLAGKEVHFPAKGYKWNELKTYNAMLREKHANVSWKQAQQGLLEGHEKLTGFIESKADIELYGSPMKGARNNWTPGRWAEAAGPSHYRSAAKYLRQRLKEVG